MGATGSPPQTCIPFLVDGYTFGISSGTTTREVWSNPPLALVAVEARFPASDQGRLRMPLFRAIRDRLGPGWVIEGAKQQNVDIAIGAAGVQHNVAVEGLTRIIARDRTRAVTLRPESIVVETTQYQGYLGFRSLFAEAFSAVEAELQPDGVTRLGLRYIDEIQPPLLEGLHPWDDWIDQSLLSPRVEGLTPQGWTSAVQYQTGDDQQLVLRYGTNDGPAVAPANGLKRTSPVPVGLIFALDFDSFWQPSEIPAFSSAQLIENCDHLHEPIRRLFNALISERLVDEVFRKERP